MKTEIPVIKRCCFCLPLRYGLLGWGYFKMTADAFIITVMLISMTQDVIMIGLSRPNEDYHRRIFEIIIFPVIAVAVFTADFVATILFIVGGHKKNVRLMRVFYFISIAMLIFSLILTATSVILTIQNFKYNIYFWERIVSMFSFYLLGIGVQTYILILLRSEIIKLRDNSEFRFVNNAAEAECTMKCEEIRVEEEMDREDV